MPDVIVIGGGLSGLCASYELEQANIDYSLIEVKRRLGGSIQTTLHNSWRVDANAFSVRPNLDGAWLEELGLSLHIESPQRAIFTAGTGALIEALAGRITAPRMMRMAVASIGKLNDTGEWGVCLENGLMLSARALIIALPARYARNVLHSVHEELAHILTEFEYDTIQRVNVGLPVAEVALTRPPFDMAYVHLHQTTHPDRVPQGMALLQVAMRIGTPRPTQSHKLLISAIQTDLKLTSRPELLSVHHWDASDLLTCYDEHHAQRLQAIRERLPEELALIGSDYSTDCPHRVGIHDLGERITRARTEAKRIIAGL